MQRIHSVLTVAAASLLFSTAMAADKAPERTVQGTTITSKADPALEITLPASAQYVGADRWDLYKVADAEVHVFVEADAQKKVQRLYWVQFEAYLPDNTHSYDYQFKEKLTHAGLDFDVRANFGPTSGPSRPGSDREHVMALIQKAGYTIGAESMNLRLVHLMDEARRKELMFIYAEDLAASGFTAEQLKTPEGEAKWLEIKKGLIERALARIKLER
jgi:hypothetical protein